MALVTRHPARPSTVSSFTPTTVSATDYRAIIAMLRSRGQITERDAARLSSMPAAIDDLVVLAMLHERRDITDVEYEFEKGERLRVAN